MLNFLGKKEKVKNIGMVIFSFGLLFEGIEIMGSVMKPLAGSPIFVDLMGKVSSVPVLGVVLGAVMTLVVQSSSATIAVLQSFASQAGPDGVNSVIGLAGAVQRCKAYRNCTQLFQYHGYLRIYLDHSVVCTICTLYLSKRK